MDASAGPRARRTRERILAAARELAAELGPTGVEVSALTRAAGIHRVTFYAHFPGIEDALTAAFADVIDELSAVDDARVAGVRDRAELADVYAATLRDALLAIRDQRDVYRVLFGWPAFAIGARDAMRGRAARMVAIVESAGIDVPGAASGVAADVLAGASAAALAAWAASDADDADAWVADIIAQLPGWWPRA